MHSTDETTTAPPRPQQGRTVSRRGQLRRRGAKTSLQRRLRRQHLQEPWWYLDMRAAGRVPEGVATDKSIGYPVILPTRQSVYILHNARNAHLARTYGPRVVSDHSEDDDTCSVCPSSCDSRSLDASLDGVVDFDEDEIDSFTDAPPIDLSFLLEDDDVVPPHHHRYDHHVETTTRTTLTTTTRTMALRDDAAEAARAVRRAQHDARRRRNERKQLNRDQRRSTHDADPFEAALAEHHAALAAAH